MVKGKRRTNISINPEVYELATQLMKLRRFSDFSGFLEQVIRDEWERRNGPAKFDGVSDSDLRALSKRLRTQLCEELSKLPAKEREAALEVVNRILPLDSASP